MRKESSWGTHRDAAGREQYDAQQSNGDAHNALILLLQTSVVAKSKMKRGPRYSHAERLPKNDYQNC